MCCWPPSPRAACDCTRVLDIESATAQPVQPEQRLNSVLGAPFLWLSDSSTVIVKRPVGTRADEPMVPAMASSPSIQETQSRGIKAAVRTYPHLLTSASDAARFRHYAEVQLVALRLGKVLVCFPSHI